MCDNNFLEVMMTANDFRRCEQGLPSTICGSTENMRDWCHQTFEDEDSNQFISIYDCMNSIQRENMKHGIVGCVNIKPLLDSIQNTEIWTQESGVWASNHLFKDLFEFMLIEEVYHIFIY